MDRQLHITYTDDLVRTSARRFVRSYLVWSAILIVIAWLLCAALLWPYGPTGPVSPTVVWMMTGALAAVTATKIGIYFTIPKRALNIIHKLGIQSVDLRFTDEAVVEVTSQLSVSKLPWKAFDQLRRYPDLWLLIYGQGLYLTLPADQLDDTLRHEIEAKVRQHGGKIR